MLDAFGRLRVVNNRSAMALTREIAAYWEGDVASTAAYLRVALHALWIHVIPTLRPWGSLKQLVAALQGRLLYIICSQLQLDRLSLIEKLKNAGDLELLFFVHDILPSLFPNFFTDGDARLYGQSMENAARLAGAIVVNSHATAESFNSRFGKRLATGTLVVAPLGVSQPANIEPPPAPRQQPCFVMLGTIEPRKNHRLILDLWLKLYVTWDHRRLTSFSSASVAGKTRTSSSYCNRAAPFAVSVEECGRLPDTTVAGLLKGALLLPSFAAGYGLPLPEALTQGTPLLCSDIAVFREVGGDIPDYLDPTNGPAWYAAVRDYAQPQSLKRQAQLRRLASWSRPAWQQHFAVVDAALRKL